MKCDVPNYQATESLRLFAQACFGVIIGVLLAVALARLLLPPDGSLKPEGLLPSEYARAYMKPREKGFYLLSLVLGGACGYFTTYRVLPRGIDSVAVWLVLLLSIPIGNQLIATTLAGGGLAAPILTAIIMAGILAFLIFWRGRPLAAVAQWPEATEQAESEKRWPFFAFLLLMTLILIPSSFVHVASAIGTNLHPAGFFIAPALYSLGHDLLPGVNYYVQYTMGMPWLFHFVMGDTAEQAVLNYTIIAILATWFFYAHLAYLLHWLYRSWTAAGVVALIPLILVFAHPDVMPAHFLGPANTVLRYPLLTVCALLTSYWAESPGKPVELLAIATAAAVSIFLETETGIIMTVTAPTVVFLVNPWRRSIVLPIGGFLAATLLIFVAVLFIVFGPGVLQPPFWKSFLKPITNFAESGMSGTPIVWALSEWRWLYNLVAPGAMLATIGVIARACGNVVVDRQRAAVLAFLAVSGLLLLVKFSNQSLMGVWQMSAIGPFSVLGWWCVAMYRHIDPGLFRRRVYFGISFDTLNHSIFRPLVDFRASLRSDVAFAMIALAFIFLYSPSETRNPASYGLKAWAEYPSLLKWPFSSPRGCLPGTPGGRGPAPLPPAGGDCMIIPDPPTAADAALIDSRTSPGEQVAIVASNADWVYLIKAQRPPLLSFLPSPQTFSIQQFDDDLRRIRSQKYIFISKGPNGEPLMEHGDYQAAIEPLLGTTFQKDGESDQLTAWKRADRQQTSQAQ